METIIFLCNGDAEYCIGERIIKNRELPGLIKAKISSGSYYFSVQSDADARQRITVSIARRQGQSKFRQSLLDAYSYKCAITNFDAEAALEAAHIIPYVETENNEPSNGLLLRADLDTLFDLNLIAIHPETMKVYIAPTLHKTKYQEEIDGRKIRIPKHEMYRPKQQFLKQRFEQCQWCQYL